LRGRSGFAHLFEHLMFQGTWTGLGTGEHLAAIQAAGGTANATTSFDRTNYFETIHPGALELALWLEAQRLEYLKVDQINLDTQREVVKEEKRQRYDNVPYGDTLLAMVELAFGIDHPYHHLPIGSMADLDAATLTDVQAFHARHYTPSNLVVVLSGAVSNQEALDLVGQHFGAIVGSEAPSQTRVPPAPAFTGTPQRLLDSAVPREDSHLLWHIPHWDSPASRALEMGLDVLANGQSSRLYQRLVVAEELAEGVSAGTLGLDGGSDLAMVSSHTREGASSHQLNEIVLEEVSRLAISGPDAEELDRVRAQVERHILTEMASTTSRADEINHWASATGDANRVNTALNDYLVIDADQISQAMTQWLSPENHALLGHRKARS